MLSRGGSEEKEVSVWAYSPPLSCPSLSLPFLPLPFLETRLQTHVCNILSPEYYLVATKLFICIAVVSKWRYGFKPANEVPVCHTDPLRALTLRGTGPHDFIHSKFEDKTGQQR